MIRIAVTVADAGMAANVGRPVQISLKTYDIECPEMESLLREGARGNTSYMQAFVSGVEILEPEPVIERLMSGPHSPEETRLRKTITVVQNSTR